MTNYPYPNWNSVLFWNFLLFLWLKTKKTLRDRRDGYMQYKRMMQKSPSREGDGCKMPYNSLHFCLGVIQTQLLSYSLWAYFYALPWASFCFGQVFWWRSLEWENVIMFFNIKCLKLFLLLFFLSKLFKFLKRFSSLWISRSGASWIKLQHHQFSTLVTQRLCHFIIIDSFSKHF